MPRFPFAPAFVAVALLALHLAPARGGELGFEEDFALSPDREAALKQLIAGTPEHYFYTCLHLQNQGKLDEVDKVLAEWVKRHGESNRTTEMQNRQALLRYEKDPRKSLDYLIWRLGLHFGHQKESVAQQRQLPGSLDPSLIARETLTKAALAHHGDTLGGFEATALDWLIDAQLSPARVHELLSRIDRPDYPNLVQLVLADLAGPYNSGFGSLPIHRQLLLAQLDELAKARPALLSDANFVMTYLIKLQPSPDLDWQHSPAEKLAYLERLWAFVGKLPPVHNSLKAHVLYHRLVFDRTQGVWDKERFELYLRLPRHVHYMRPEHLQRDEHRGWPVNLGADYVAGTLLPVIGNDEPLVRSYLLHFLAEAESYEAYAPYVHEHYLRQVFAEAKLLAGVGEQAKWYALLSPQQHKALNERVDIDFAFTNPPRFGVDEPVRLEVFTKNVPTLLVKVYEVNTLSYYKTQLREIDTDINLDGLVANKERVEKYADPPIRRVSRVFEFPEIDRRGVYVVDFIGSGVSSRAVVRKGRLQFVERIGSAGHVLTVLDEANQPVKDARVHVAGHEYAAEKDTGEIVVPFTAEPGPQPIVIASGGGGGFASLDTLEHQAENYQLQAAMYVDREALLRYAKASVIIRPSLRVNGVPVAIKLLEDVVLAIGSVDREGVATVKEVRDFALKPDGETTYEFTVPDKLAQISFTLRSRVQNVSLNRKEDLAAQQIFNLNDIDKTEKIEDLHLSHVAGEYVIDLLGKTGEPKAGRPIQLTLKHRDFTQPVHATLKTDAAGRVRLGKLEDIVTVTAGGPEGVSHTWSPAQDRAVRGASLHGVAGAELLVPYVGEAKEVTPRAFSLLETRGGTFYADRADSLALRDGYLVLQDLPAGDYSLRLKETGETIHVRLTDGPPLRGWVLGENRQLETLDTTPLHVAAVEAGDDSVTIQLANAGDHARVHVIATRFVPRYDVFGTLAVIRWPEPQWVWLPKLDSLYIVGRNIGDEYRYILDRKYADPLPGNMLTRPGLLLNPWAIRKTETAIQQAQQGEAYDGTGAGGGRQKNAPVNPSAPPQTQPPSPGADHFANLDFLATPSVVLSNLRPDKDGKIVIARKDLGAHQQIHVVAVDEASTIYREVSLPELPGVNPRDLRLTNNLDPTKHFTEQKQTTILAPGESFSIADAGTSAMETYDSLARVYRLYATLNPNPNLAEFGFVLQWPKLKPEEKREKYAKYACHELNFFLARKDPEFFEAVVRPYLKNKKDKTFMDRYLLEEDLSGYLEAWRYGRLNTLERILLAERIEGEAAKTARHVKDRYDLLPRDVERFNRLFLTAIRGSALDTSQGFAFEEKSGEGRATLQFGAGVALNGATPTAAPAPATESATAEGGKKESGARGTTIVERQLQDMEKVVDEAQPLSRDAKDKLGALRKRNLEAAKQSLASETEAYFARNGDADAARREDLRRLYQKLDLTQEWAENNYYHLPIEQQNAELIPVSALWRDYAAFVSRGRVAGNLTFLSSNLTEGHRTFAEMMLALAVLDLPFEAGKHETQQKDAAFSIKAASPMVIFHKAITETKPAAEKTPILVSQNYFRHSDRYRFEDNERIDKYVADEFLIHVVYGCQVVITNPTSSRQKLDLLLQVPRGAIPVLNGQYTRGLHVELEPYQARSIEYHFYFPLPGEFPHYPAHVARNEELIAFTEPTTLKAVEKLSKEDTQSWDYISQNGTDEQVIEYLSANNIDRLNLDKIAWRMGDAAFFDRVVTLLRERHVFHATLWSYALKHDRVEPAREYLQHRDDFVSQVGAYLASKLLTIDPVIRRSYQHLEYAPLVNARAHSLGKERQILNDRFFEQYQRLMNVLAYRPALDSDDRMAVTYYLLLQDRVAEARAFFGEVDPAKLETRLQHDYFASYLAFYEEDPKAARQIAGKYKDYPVDRWRKLFAAVLSQIDELEGKAADVIDKENRDQQQAKLTATEPGFEFKAEARKITFDYQNLAEVRVNFYLMDLELLFSQNPFIQAAEGDAGQFAFIRPNQTAVLKLDPKKRTATFDLPEAFHSSNVMIEAIAAGERESRAYYANTLAVQVVENYGQLRVASERTGEPLPKVYVKVYARKRDGSVAFYKDGYTDLRGRFDYTSLNTNELDNVERFAILILSTEEGAVVREAAPPKR